MHDLIVCAIVFLCLMAGALLGMQLRRSLPQTHLNDDSKHLLEIGLGIIGTMAGLVLGLLVASATGSYNAQRNELFEFSSQLVLLDRALAQYGPEANDARATLKVVAERVMAEMWQKTAAPVAPESAHGQALFEEIEKLSPKTDEQKTIKGLLVGMAVSTGQTRVLMFEQLASSISVPLLVLLVFWFTVTFMGFGLFAPNNSTVVVALALGAISISGAVYLMLEMYTPFQGLMQLSSAPLQEAIAQLGR
jgi:hypothetical protein